MHTEILQLLPLPIPPMDIAVEVAVAAAPVVVPVDDMSIVIVMPLWSMVR